MMPVVVGAPGAANAAHRTLDVEQRQVLIRMDEEAQRYWHHLLLHRVSGSTWITCDPHGDVVVEDLAGEEVVPLSRSAAFPVAGRPHLAFSETDEISMADIRSRAATLAEVHGISLAVTTVPLSAVWVFADSSHPLFATEVPSRVVADPARARVGGSVGICSADGPDGRGQEWTHMERVNRPDLARWTSDKREGAGRDPRLSSLHAPSSGHVRVLFRDAMAARSEEKIPDITIFEGPAAFPELAIAILRSGLEPQGFLASYLLTSGLNPKSSLAIELGHHLFAIWTFSVVDRLDPNQSATVEHIARRVLQIQKAVKRNPKNPDFEGLGEYMKHSADASQTLGAPAFDRHVAEKQKVEGMILKQQRLQREEVEHDNKHRKPAKGGKPEGGKGQDPG